MSKFDSNGDLQWARLLGGVGENNLWSMISEEDGSVVGTAYTSGYGEGNFDILVFKLSTSGNLEKVRTFGTSSA